MKRFVFVEVDRYRVVDSKVMFFENEEECKSSRELLIREVKEMWGYDNFEKEYGDKIVVKENVCGLDLEEVSYLVKEIW
jgi:hypothetical protein